MSEKVSVCLVVPAGSVERPEVQDTLRSISSQSYPSSLIEVIQVQYAASVPAGLSSALNAAREGASGVFVIHTRPGVVWDGNKVERQVLRLQEAPGAGACVHRMTAREAGGKTRAMDLGLVRAYGPMIGCLLEMPWGPGAAVLRRDVLQALGSYRSIEDTLWEYAVRLVCRGHALELIDEDLAVWNLDEEAGAAGMGGRRVLIPAGVRYGFVSSYLSRTRSGALFSGGEPAWAPGADLVLAGLFEHNDDLEAAHALCQTVCREHPCPEANYWHGVIHRREPDFANARGWFEKAGTFGALAEIQKEALGCLQRAIQMPDYGEARETAFEFLRRLQTLRTWDAPGFAGLCEACAEKESPQMRRLLEEVQAVELRTLFDWTYRKAMGEAEN